MRLDLPQFSGHGKFRQISLTGRGQEPWPVVSIVDKADNKPYLPHFRQQLKETALHGIV
jgi:hypothetical protein